VDQVGIDIGSRESQVCIRNGVGEVIKEVRCKTGELGRMLEGRAKNRVIVETCTEAFRIADTVIEPTLRFHRLHARHLAQEHSGLYFFCRRFHTVTIAAQPTFEAGRVYRTRELGQWSANPPRLAQRLVRNGQLVQLAHGLFAAPRRSRFGAAPPTDEALLHAFLDGGPLVFTGPERWNALGLGTTEVFAAPLVYNTKRSGLFDFRGRRFLLRRVAFPEAPSPEWFVVDLFENAEKAASAPSELRRALEAALRAGKFDRDRLASMSARYGSRRTQALVNEALETSMR